MLCGEGPTSTERISESCNPSLTGNISCNNTQKTESLTNSTTPSPEGDENNNVILSLAGGSIAVIVVLLVGFAGIKLYKAKFSRRRNFNYTLSAEDNGNIVGDENRVNC
jgi:hypothetical protein